MEYYKIYCSTHPYEYITNFCADTNCLIGLCATCICEHTQFHIQKGTSPKYENIKNTYTRYNQMMREQIHTIQQDKEWLNSVCQKIEQKRKNVGQTLSKARQDCLALVNRHFDDLEGKISSQIVSQSKKNSLHSAFRLQTLNNLILKEISSLLLYSSELSSPKFLDTAKLMEEQVFPSSRDFHLRVSKELKENQVYTANAIYREDLLGDLGLSLKRLINLEFLLPRVEYVTNSSRVQRVEEVRRPNSLRKCNSSMIVQPRQLDFLDSSMIKRSTITLMPKKTTSIIVGTNSTPLQQVQQMSGWQSQVSSPLLAKGSRLSSGLRVIRQQKRGFTPKEDLKSMSSSNVSWNGKQNESLAHSTYYDTGSNFFH